MEPIYIVIEQERTGRNIQRLMAEHGVKVRDVQCACGFEKPQAVYKWLHGQSLPSLESLLVLARLLNTNMEGILVTSENAFSDLRMVS